MDPTEVVRKAQEAGVKLIRFLYCDNGGIIRGKSTHISELAFRMQSGIGLTKAMQAMNALDQLQSVEGMGPVGEVRLVPDANTFVLLPYAPRTAAMIVDLLEISGQPWGACPRSFLKRMVERAAHLGIKVVASFEPEWTLAKKTEDGFLPVDESLCFSSVGMTTPAEVIDAMVEALEAQGLQVEQYHPELGHGQQELTIRHAEALRAADNHILYRETVRGVGWQHGLYVSLAPKPFLNQAGNGCHIHFSAWDEKGETNLFFDREGHLGLSEMGYEFMGGILAHLPALVAITCPSYNSYRRLQPQSWASAFICFGPDNREGAIRVVSSYWGHEMTSINLELKPADNSCNPYLALGALIATGLDGLERRLRPSPDLLVEVDPATISPEERARRGIHRLPDTLDLALDELENDPLLLDALGEMLARSYVSVRRSESRVFSGQDEAFEVKHHFYKY